MKKFCESLREHEKNIIEFENVTINKRRTKIISKCKSVLYLSKRIPKSLLIIKNIKKLETLVILQANMEL